MSTAVLLVHSAGPQGPGEGSQPFAARLRGELGSGFEVHFPLMPEPENPHVGPWSTRLGEILARMDDPLVMVGHSLGGSVVLKHLAEHDQRKPIAGLVLVGTPFWGEAEWEAEWALPEGWPGPAAELPRTYLFHSRDDEEIPFAHLERYRLRLSGATARPLDGNGHLFDRGDLTEVLEAIRDLSAA